MLQLVAMWVATVSLVVVVVVVVVVMVVMVVVVVVSLFVNGGDGGGGYGGGGSLQCFHTIPGWKKKTWAISLATGIGTRPTLAAWDCDLDTILHQKKNKI